MLVGILGGGQLGQMLAQAGARIGVRCRFLDPDPDACAGSAGELITGSFDDERALTRFASGCDAVTFEFENVPAAAVRHVARILGDHCVRPGPACLEVAQDRVSEKQFFARAGLETPAWFAVDSAAQLRDAVAGGGPVGVPCVLKTRRGGYDGKGQAVLRSADDTERAWAAIGGHPAIVERLVPFTRELSVIAVRGVDGTGGAFDHYPLVENTHERGILRVSRAPAPSVDARVEREAVAHVRTLMETMNYVGVLAVELFEVNGVLLANEMAPRVHNSGHWTIEGAHTSQFENHLRAVCGLPLGPCDARGPSAMVNFIGGVPRESDITSIPGAHAHLYGKAGRAGRKVGHATLVGEPGAVHQGIEPALARLREVAARCDAVC